jgi:hypothetical protein
MRAPPHTGFDASGQQSGFEPMAAEGALVSLAGVVVDETCIKGAGLNAVSTANTTVAVNHHNAVFSFEGRAHRTNGNAGRLVAVVAQTRQHREAGFSILTRHRVGRDHRAKLPLRGSVFHGAGHGAGLAGNATPGINQHRPMWAGCFCSHGRHGQTRSDYRQGRKEGAPGKIRMSTHAKLRFLMTEQD